MEVHQIFTDSPLRNYTYLIEGNDREFICIDPYDAEQVIRFLKTKNGKLRSIINTHEHYDHICGNDELIDKTGCELWTHTSSEKLKHADRFLKANESILFGKGELRVLDTPGHTFSHLCLLGVIDESPIFVISGDTLFNAGVGNCKNGGNVEALYETYLKFFEEMPDEVILYPGHEYFENNLKFTLKNEPHNMNAKDLLKKVEKIDFKNESLLTNFKKERQINSFFRLDENTSDGLSKKQTFIKLRQLRDNW